MHSALEYLLYHGLWVIFVWVLVEQLGAPVPSIPILLATGALIGAGRMSWMSGLGLIVIASLIADCTWYVLGRHRGPAILRLLCRISLEPDSCVSSTRRWFSRLGAWALVISKFVPGVGAVAAPMSGLSGMQLWKFVAADGAGILVWSGAYLGAGFLFREQLEDAAAYALHIGGSVLGAAGAAIVLWIAWKYWKRRRFIRSLRIARITPEEVFARLDNFAILDLRSESEMELDGMKLPGAMWFDRQHLAVRHSEIPRDRDVVLYCT
jgi:membrane protein DedA with SNARE-associated domain